MTPANVMEALGIYTSQKEKHQSATYVRKAMLNNLAVMCRQAEDRSDVNFAEMRTLLDAAERADAEARELAVEVNRAAELCGKKTV